MHDHQFALLQVIREELEGDGFTKELVDRGQIQFENEIEMVIQNSQPHHRNWTVIMQSSSIVSYLVLYYHSQDNASQKHDHSIF